LGQIEVLHIIVYRFLCVKCIKATSLSERLWYFLWLKIYCK